MVYWIFVGVATLMVLDAVVARRRTKQRSEALRALASGMGLDFADADETGLRAGFDCFKLFSYGRERTIENIAYGRLGEAEVMLFDYSYTVGGKDPITHYQTVTFFQSDALGLPDFVTRPEGLFDKVGQVFGYHDIDLPLHPEFSRRYILRGADEGRIRDFFTADLARFFEANPGLSVEAKFDRFILYRAGRHLRPIQWREWLAKGREAFNVLRR